jgi:hypothetical protein
VGVSGARRSRSLHEKSLSPGDSPISRQSASLSSRAALLFSTVAACMVGLLDMVRQACALTPRVTRTASSMMTMLSRNPQLMPRCTRIMSAQSTFSMIMITGFPWGPGAGAPSCGGSISPVAFINAGCLFSPYAFEILLSPFLLSLSPSPSTSPYKTAAPSPSPSPSPFPLPSPPTPPPLLSPGDCAAEAVGRAGPGGQASGPGGSGALQRLACPLCSSLCPRNISVSLQATASAVAEDRP